MSRPVIALTGLMGAGKTTCAMHLTDKHNYRRIRFAGPLKDMAYAFGLSWRHIDGDLKEEPCDLLAGKSPREFMQLLGTEFGRNLIDPNIWVRAWHHAVAQVPEGIGIVVDDCRFPNEAQAARELSGRARIVRVVREGSEAPAAHISELQAFHADTIIINSGSKEDLYRQIDQLARRIIKSHR